MSPSCKLWLHGTQSMLKHGTQPVLQPYLGPTIYLFLGCMGPSLHGMLALVQVASAHTHKHYLHSFL